MYGSSCSSYEGTMLETCECNNIYLVTSATLPMTHLSSHPPCCFSQYIWPSCTTSPPHKECHQPRACAESCTLVPSHLAWSTIAWCMVACTHRWLILAQTLAHTVCSHQIFLLHILFHSSSSPPSPVVAWMREQTSNHQTPC